MFAMDRICSEISSYRSTDKVAIIERIFRRLHSNTRVNSQRTGANMRPYWDAVIDIACTADTGATPKIFGKLRELATYIFSDNSGDLLLFLFFLEKHVKSCQTFYNTKSHSRNRKRFYFIQFKIIRLDIDIRLDTVIPYISQISYLFRYRIMD